MSWRDQLRIASFRGVLMHVETASGQFGRRTALHEFPGRDEPYGEDLGRRTRQFTLECYVLGEQYMAARDALIDAIEQPGPGVLSHPYLGMLNVIVTEARTQESTREGGMCRFTLTCVESGELTFPTVTADTAERVSAARTRTLADAIADFGEHFSVLGQAQDFVDAVQRDLDRTLAAVDAVVGGVTGPVAALIRAPYDMGAALVGAVGQVRTTLTEPLRALAIYQGLFNAGADAATVPLTTANRRRQAANQEAVHQLTQRAAVAEAAELSSTLGFASSAEALSLRATLTDAIDAQQEQLSAVTGAPVSDSVYDALAALRAAVGRDLTDRGARLPRVRTHTPRAALPAVVVGHQVYGDATRADEIVARNRIRHPGFVPGGRAIEVLTDAA